MRKFMILKRVRVEDSEPACWIAADPDAIKAVDPADAVMKFLVKYGEKNFGWRKNLAFHWCGDLCEVYYTDNSMKIEIDFRAEEIEE